MSQIVTGCEQHDSGSEHSPLRLAMYAHEPVYLSLNLDGIDVDPIVERLDIGQASFVCSNHFALFYEGQMIGPAVLALEDQGMAVVYPVVKSKNWPLISVEFMEISEEDRQMITRFLAKSSGGLRPPTGPRSKTATAGEAY